MPRFVRPAWIALNVDGRASDIGAGPKSRDGFLSGAVTLRTADATVSDRITFDAGGSDARGRARFVLDVPGTFEVEVETDVSGRTHLVARAR